MCGIDHIRIGDMKVLLLEPFYGGSHKVFVDTFVKYSSHNIDLLTLPGRFFKWRTRGASYEFITKITNISQYDLIFCGSMLSVADLRTYFRGELNAPIVTYFHETQFSYPIKKGESFDVQFGLNDVSTAMASDWCIFNSKFHRDQFEIDMKKYLGKMPDFQPLWVIEEIAKKSRVVYPCSDFASSYQIDSKPRNTHANIVFNHRWEHDKNPEEFFKTLYNLSKKGYEFSLFVLGESYKSFPEIFDWARENLTDHIKHFGFVDSKTEYYNILQKCDLVVSTSWQENYGISVIEAMSYGCMALLPNRLSYPELLEKSNLSMFLYKNLGRSLVEVFEMTVEERLKHQSAFLKCMEKFKPQNLVEELDSLFKEILS